MCLIAFSYKQNKKYPLVLVANRDEYYERPTSPADYWDESPDILAGRDLQSKGTWMGVTKTGRIALLTNYRDIPSLKEKAPSRGLLVSDFLNSDVEPQKYLEGLKKYDFKYNGYNLIVGDLNKLMYHSNFAAGISDVEPGVHALSNHLLDTEWPKSSMAKKKLESLQKKSSINVESLMKMMNDDRIAPDYLLPNTGIGLKMERQLSPMFIKMKSYGTRCTTVVLIDKNHRLTFVERTYNLSDFTFTDRSFEFKIR